MNKRAILALGAIVLVFMQYADALQQPGDSNDLQTLPDYLRYASINNAELKAKFEEWKAALEQVPQARALDDPKFTFMKEVQTPSGPKEERFSIMQEFPWLGKIEARTDAASANANAARKQYEAAKLKLFWQIKDAFGEYVYLAEAIKIAKQNLELLEHFEEIARIKYATAAAAHPDIIRAQVEMAILEDVLKSLEKLREPIVARLNATLNRPTTAELPWPKKQQLKPARLDRGQLIKILKDKNPELAGLNWEIEAAKSMVDLAKKKFYPDIGVGVEWMHDGGVMSAGDNGKDPIFLMFSMNLPLWRDSYKAAEQQAKANVRKIQEQRTDIENKILSSVFEVLYDIEDSQRKMYLYGDVLVSKAEELVQASETAYQAGTIDFLSLIDAQRMLLKYELDYERAVTNNQQKLAELEMLVGTELPSIAEPSMAEPSMNKETVEK